MVHAVRARAPRGVGVRSEDIRRIFPAIEREMLTPEDAHVAELTVEAHHAIEALGEVGPAAWRWRSVHHTAARAFALDALTTRIHASCARAALKALARPETPAERGLERALQCARFGRVEQARGLFDEFIRQLVPERVEDAERVRRFVRAPVLSVAFRFGARSLAAPDEAPAVAHAWRGFGRDKGLVTRTTDSGTRQMVEERRRLEVGFGLLGIPLALIGLEAAVNETFTQEFTAWVELLAEHVTAVRDGRRGTRRDREIAAEALDARRCPGLVALWERLAATVPALAPALRAFDAGLTGGLDALVRRLSEAPPRRHGEYQSFLVHGVRGAEGAP
jgi:hypothetical protein